MARHRRRKKHHAVQSRALCLDTGKRQYGDYGDAARVALRRSRYAGPLRIYECPSCGAWHLTKRRSWGKPPAS
ncbi:hypothetical protein F8227_16020 [Brevibacterium linens ATCC 9172]|uniref:Uncharacterized protein n=2 Tax=Brevibacterium TaxID=1696 RepID=A0A2H1KP33_BRELN|nr:hypothetical protein [Brevibacterium antiquum]KAB1943091.1 hypothetical protein F8227_16020 [Brevibacterium linens ATCC 9172]SMX92546.1 hypothetical protein BANT10_02512 [Brevibacterium antiquum]SMY01451.1 hypothetical protein BLIN9172_03390 [Brevibacterium linens ATCC 9172]